ncbi:hypothetical protein CC78DRAFT_566412 [Lojkania enalia]|uniref:WLM domain-containing protein n=1 Tax=Lojkania enalia TaxID=147567 RepID=A0A9P4KF18_9PLEO|nr:hypothetical protein CC78DRAFT_566412 [Didymosphaeria enalia]
MRLGSVSRAGLCLLLLAAPVCSQATWWIDKSCDKHFPDGELHKMMEEVVDTAKLIRDRLIRSETDEPDAHRGFETLFKFKTSTKDNEDQQRLRKFQSIIGGFGGFDSYPLSEFKKTGDGALDRRLSRVRIHCDNGDRWELVKDGEETIEPKVPKNSERKPEDQEFFDTVNKIWIKGDVKCGKLTDKEPLMQTARWSGESDHDVPKGTEIKGRSTITVRAANPKVESKANIFWICDHWLNLKDRLNLFKDIPTEKTLSWSKKAKESIHNLRFVGSMALFHELTHTLPHKTRDFEYSSRTWSLGKDKAFMNADSYGILAVIFRSMERKFALNRDHPEEGTLHKYKDIPDRVKHTKRSKLESKWLPDERDTVLSCEDRHNTTDTGLRCERFIAIFYLA